MQYYFSYVHFFLKIAQSYIVTNTEVDPACSTLATSCGTQNSLYLRLCRFLPGKWPLAANIEFLGGSSEVLNIELGGSKTQCVTFMMFFISKMAYIELMRGATRCKGFLFVFLR